MSAAAVDSAPSTTHSTSNAQRWVTLVTGWRVSFALLAVVAAAALWFGYLLPQWAIWRRVLAAAVLLIGGVASGAAVPLLLRRRHAGRVLSLGVDYVGFIASAIFLLNRTGVFLSIDALSDTFGRGVPWLGAAFIGYLITTLSDRFEHAPAARRRWQRVGAVVAAVAALGFLVAVDGLQGIAWWLGQLVDPVALGTLLAALVFGAALWIMWREPAARLLGAKVRDSEMLSGWLLLSPNLLGFLIFFAGPLLLSLYFSFTDSDAFNPPNWVGLSNYANIFNLTFQPLATPDQLASAAIDVTSYDELARFTIFGSSYIIGAADRLFWLALRNTLVFALVAVPLSVIPALVLSNFLNMELPGMKFFRAVYFLPSIAATVGIALVWQWLYNATIGYINYFITLGVEFLNGFGLQLVDPRIQWLSDNRTALLAVIIVTAWQTTGFNTVLFLAGLQSIPRALYEAATVDGAGAWAKFRNVTLPLLAPTTFFVVTTTTIQALQVFEQIFILVSPTNATMTMVLYLYRSGFQNFRQGYASAIAWVLFLIIFVVTIARFQRQGAGGEAYDG